MESSCAIRLANTREGFLRPEKTVQMQAGLTFKRTASVLKLMDWPLKQMVSLGGAVFADGGLFRQHTRYHLIPVSRR
jgi:hypothetical protein